MELIEIGKLIKDRRDILAINQEDLSEMTGITAKTIYLIENGKGNPSFITLSKLLDILGLEIIVQIKKVSG
ncbi:helix-turn-helix transcriptional regulator [Niabella sp. 22666]|uniref:helix-turn-helix transcriptional regulator n=1 Tax=Niabella sp. 22666 TaxID=3453954 RepID=UPI003F879103